MSNRRSFLGASLGIASAAAAGRTISVTLPPASGRSQIKIRDVETVLLRFPPGRLTADTIHTPLPMPSAYAWSATAAGLPMSIRFAPRPTPFIWKLAA